MLNKPFPQLNQPATTPAMDSQVTESVIKHPGVSKAPETASQLQIEPLSSQRRSIVVAVSPDPETTASSSNLALSESDDTQGAHASAIRPLGSRKRSAPLQEPKNKRRRQRAGVEGAVKPAMLKKIVYTTDMTAQIMLWFQECKNQGLFNSSKRKDYHQVWENVHMRCKEAWPQYPWTTSAIATKYDTERSRYRIWKSLLDYSGVSYNEFTQLPEAAESVWESFLARHNTNKKNNIWLRYIPLGDREVYSSVFWRERATGRHITEAEDLSTQPVSQTTDDGENSGDDDLHSDAGGEGGDNTDSIEGVEAERPTPITTKPLTASQQHRLDTNPDSKHRRSSSLASSEPPLVIPQGSQRAKAPSLDPNAFGRSLEIAAATVANPQTQSAGDIKKAAADLEERYGADLNEAELANCLIYLYNNPSAAVMWNAVGSRAQKALVARWKVG